jgi:hypothetical protein
VSTAAVRKAGAVRPAAKSRPKLVVISGPRVASRTPFLVLIGLLMLASLLSLLMLHTLAAQDSFRQTSLQQRLANLTDTEQRLQQQLQIDSGPAALRHRAKALGMVPSVITSYHQLPNGRIVAHEVAASSVTTTSTVAVTTNDDDDTAKPPAGADDATTKQAKQADDATTKHADDTSTKQADNATPRHDKPKAEQPAKAKSGSTDEPHGAASR